MRKISVSAMDGSRREMGADPQWCIDMVNMWTRVRFLTSNEVTGSHSTGQPLSQSWLAAVKPHNPFVETDAYVVSSDVSLAEYLCTHGCLIYVYTGDFSLASVFCDEFDVDRLVWESQTEVWFLWRVLQIVKLLSLLLFLVVCTQACYASVACMTCMMGHVTPVCNITLCWLL